MWQSPFVIVGLVAAILPVSAARAQDKADDMSSLDKECRAASITSSIPTEKHIPYCACLAGGTSAIGIFNARSANQAQFDERMKKLVSSCKATYL